MFLEKFTPKKFLCRFPLNQGAVFVGFFILVVAIICVICLSVEIIYYKQCTDCTALIVHNAYSFSINSIIYCIMMVFINCWFIWGVKRGKSTVVLSWVVITGLWWVQSFMLVFIMTCMYVADTSLGWIVALASAIVAFMIFGYCISVVYGYWLEMRRASLPPATNT